MIKNAAYKHRPYNCWQRTFKSDVLIVQALNPFLSSNYVSPDPTHPLTPSPPPSPHLAPFDEIRTYG